MNTDIFIPSKINVGFQNRQDTYTGKLAYVIYFDEKGKLRKETSWENWRDKNISNEIYDNEPIDGFVLNKKVGGNNYSWNPRQTYTRVYDPRGFEFEITIQNLLWILENCNCIKGKGLEGQFVYGWDGKELVLVPTESPDYKEIQAKNKIIHGNEFIKAKDLILGATYITLKGDKYVYMGKYDVYEQKVNYYKNLNSWGYTKKYEWDYELDDSWIDDVVFGNEHTKYKNINKGKHFWFIKLGDNESKYSWLRDCVCYFKSITRKFIDVVSTNCDKYTEHYSLLEHSEHFSPIDYKNSKLFTLPLEDFKTALSEHIVNNKTTYFHFYSGENGRLVHRYIGYDVTHKYYYCKYYENKYDHFSNIIDNTQRICVDIDSIEDVYTKLNPVYGEQYLENGKLYVRWGYYGKEK